MTSDSATVEAPEASDTEARNRFTLALCGNPNTGKSTIFNNLTGLRVQTANFPGTTIEKKTGTMKSGDRTISVLDLPGMYSFSAATAEERISAEVLVGNAEGVAQPDAVVAVIDAENLERSLFLISQLAENKLPIVVALNMVDVAQRRGIKINAEALSEDLGCPVVPMSARNGSGIEELRNEIEHLLEVGFVARVPGGSGESVCASVSACNTCSECPFTARYTWAEEVTRRCVEIPHEAKEHNTEKIDKFLTHPFIGLVAFAAIILAVFYLIFSVASVPMDMIDALFGHAGDFASRVIPDGDFQSLVVDGIIGGVGGILVFLPQICILFFFLALLESSGYQARAAFVMDRLMRRVGLPGMSFVPLLSAHACAIPAIMATRVIRDPRDRLVTILIAPLMSCSARIPVYAMVTALLFPDDPAKAALVFTGAYLLGILSALVVAFVFKRTILPGESKPLVVDLPSYRLPSLKAALIYTYDRAKVFVQQAGTVILVISVVLWALATYPKSDSPESVVTMYTEAEQLADAGQKMEAAELAAEASRLDSQSALEKSAAGRLGKLIEPVVAPLGFDWQIGIGIISSFAAREVIVSTLSIVYGLGEEGADEEVGLYDTLREAKRIDGSPVFTSATCISLLVFYVLAMQCLPTQAITRRETNGWKWAIFQLVYMSVLAYSAAFVAYQVVLRMG